jgi:hypothetical protein
MLLSENLKNLTIDIEMLTINLQKIITSSLEMILPKFINQPKKIKLLSKLYKQFNHELKRISKHKEEENLARKGANNQNIKQTIYILKSIKKIISKLKSAHKIYKKNQEKSKKAEERNLSEKRRLEKVDCKIEEGISLMKSNFGGKNTFSEREYGAQNQFQNICGKKINYNMNLDIKSISQKKEENLLANPFLTSISENFNL